MIDKPGSLESEIHRWHKRWSLGQKLWSFVHHGTLIGAAVASVVVAFSLQFDGNIILGVAKNNLSTGFALVAATFSGIAAVGGFERKWKANRLSLSKLDQLRLKSLKEGANTDELIDDLTAIVGMHDRQIIGDSDENGNA